MYGTDKRSEERKDISIPAIVRSKDGLYKSSCTIQSASKHGCKIVTLKIDELPDIICLDIQGLNSPMEGQIVWRRKDCAGVKFTI